MQQEKHKHLGVKCRFYEMVHQKNTRKEHVKNHGRTAVRQIFTTHGELYQRILFLPAKQEL